MSAINHPSYSNNIGPGAEELVSRAIRDSVHYDRTVSLDYSECFAEILMRDCDDVCESEHVYWGTEEDGGEWQIRLVSHD